MSRLTDILCEIAWLWGWLLGCLVGATIAFVIGHLFGFTDTSGFFLLGFVFGSIGGPLGALLADSWFY